MQIDIAPHGFIRLIGSLGDDLTVVNAARVSFAKVSKELSEKDEKLIRYLATNKHFSPFRHVMVQLHIKAPEFIARQAWKHTVGGSYEFKDTGWNELSGRYVNYEETLWFPEYFRGKAQDKKQGSLDTAHKYSNYWREIFIEKTEELYGIYQRMVEDGIAPEQARTILPLNFYTEWYWTLSLQAAAHFYALRIDPHAQKEIQEYARGIDKIMKSVTPISWEILKTVSV